MVPTLAPSTLQARAHARVADEQGRRRQVDHRIEIEFGERRCLSRELPGAG
jgi:hypothetical protein